MLNIAIFALVALGIVPGCHSDDTMSLLQAKVEEISNAIDYVETDSKYLGSVFDYINDTLTSVNDIGIPLAEVDSDLQYLLDALNGFDVESQGNVSGFLDSGLQTKLQEFVKRINGSTMAHKDFLYYNDYYNLYWNLSAKLSEYSFDYNLDDIVDYANRVYEEQIYAELEKLTDEREVSNYMLDDFEYFVGRHTDQLSYGDSNILTVIQDLTEDVRDARYYVGYNVQSELENLENVYHLEDTIRQVIDGNY